MICPNCGAKNEDAAKFCKTCGQPLPDQPPPDRRLRLALKVLIGLLVTVLVVFGGVVGYAYLRWGPGASGSAPTPTVEASHSTTTASPPSEEAQMPTLTASPTSTPLPIPSPTPTPLPSPTPTPTQMPVAPWPMKQHDPQHTSRSPYQGPRQPSLKWTLDGLSFPVIAANDTLYAIGDEGTLHAVSSSGEDRRLADFDEKVTGNLALGGNDTICVPTEAGLRAFDLEGNSRWFYPLDAGAQQVVGFVGGTVVVSSEEMLYSIGQEGEAVSACDIRYSIQPLTIDHEGFILFGNHIPQGLKRVDPLTCRKQTLLPCEGGCFGPWAWMEIRADGEIYIFVTLYSATGTVTGLNHLWAVGPSGSDNWRYPPSPFLNSDQTSPREDALHQMPALGDDGRAYVGLGSTAGLEEPRKRLGAINPDGTLDWAHEVDGELRDIVVGGSVVYGITESGRVYAFGTEGAQRWTFDLGEPGSLAVGDGALYVSTGDSLHAIGEAE